MALAVAVVCLFAVSAKPESLSDAPASKSFISARVDEAGGKPSLSLLNKSSEEEEVVSNVDLESAELAAVVGQESGLLVESNVNEYRDTLVTQKTVAPIQAEIVDKPQTTAGAGSLREVVEYVTVEGDTIPTIANKFVISADTVRWANNITGDLVAPGTKLKILPISGVLVVARGGDTPKSIADGTGASAEEIALFNDIDLNSTIPEGTQIIVPNGSPRSTPTTGRSSRGSRSSNSSSYSFASSFAFSGGNTYSRGYCTWHAANRRAQIGRPIPNRMGNAIRWASNARAAGYAVDGNPRAGDVLWHRNIGGAGHVAFVESVNGDGSLLVSDMNYPSWGRVTYRTVSTGEFGNYLFIH